MPRQLPWLAKGSGAASKATATRTAGGHPKTQDDSDDDFFDGTILAKKKRKVPSNLAPIPNKIYRFNGTPQLSERALSSSPPPQVSELPAPKIELMHQALNPYDLRDDEYMMVEDEFLQTAKLFTRHLHLAEYERLKLLIKSKIDNGQEITRPVLANAQVPEDRKIRLRAEKTKKAQRNALRSVMEEGEEEEDEGRDVIGEERKEGGRSKEQARADGRSGGSWKASLKTRTPKARDTTSDSSDLDATPRPKHQKRPHPTSRPPDDAPPSSPPGPAPTFVKPTLPASKSKPSTTTSFSSRYTTTKAAVKSAALSSSFNAAPATKPPAPSPVASKPRTSSSTLPITTNLPRKRHRAGRSLFDLLDDDFDSPAPGSSTPKATVSFRHDQQPVTHAPVTQRTSVSSTSARSALISQERRERAGSETESAVQRQRSRDRLKGREKGGNAEEERRGSITLDDIPTFLF